MKRRLALGVLACLAGAGAIGVRDGAQAALEALGLFAPVSGAALGAALLARRSRARLGSLARQLAIAVWIAVGAILVAVWAAAGLMFISSDDALLVSVIAAVIAVVGASVSALLTDGVVSDVERLRERLRAVGRGDRRTDLRTSGRDELQEVAHAANTMIERLAAEERAHVAAEDARRQLMVAVSHDLRTPIASLRLLAEAIEDRVATGAVRRRYLREMQTHVAILSSLIEDLFDMARLQAGEIQLSARRVELGELVSETTAAMRAAAKERGVSLRAEPPAGHGPGLALAAHGDQEQIRRVVLNLIDNAIVHSPPGSTVTVRAIPGDGEVEVEVADEGLGIPAEERERVFEAFFRGGEDAARSRDGAGLGLSIARAIVHAHGGRIWLAEAQRGTRVRFTVPTDARAPARAGQLSPRLPTSSARAG